MKFHLDNLRLFLKFLVTAWVPIAVLIFNVDWDTTKAVLIMGASTTTIDMAFRVFGIGDVGSDEK